MLYLRRFQGFNTQEAAHCKLRPGNGDPSHHPDTPLIKPVLYISLPGQVQRNDQVRSELDGVVARLEDYLNEVETHWEQQQHDRHRLSRQHGQLLQHVAELEAQQRQGAEQEEELGQLQEVRHHTSKWRYGTYWF